MNSITSGEARRDAAGWALPVVQLLATLAILALPIGSLPKLVAFVAIWVATFRRLTRRELVCYLGVCALFSVMDVMAVRQGAFRFSQVDLAGLPIWEFFMWGFLVLHMLRTLGGPAPQPRWLLVLPLAVLFAVPFTVLTDPSTLLLISGALLALALFFFHERRDVHYVVYAVLLGAAFEYVGVWSNQWHYPADPVGGVEFWFVTMWGGIGLFTRRLVLPWVSDMPQPTSKLHPDSIR